MRVLQKGLNPYDPTLTKVYGPIKTRKKLNKAKGKHAKRR